MIHTLRKFLGALTLKLLKFELTGKLPDEKKFFVIIAPHTTNWDFVFANAVSFIMNIKVHFFAKKEIFIFPFSILFRRWGGIALDRDKAKNIVQASVDEYRRRDSFVIALAPEGSRSYRDKWKSGFYRIALEAKVPIVGLSMDYKHRQLKLSEPMHLSGDLEQDINLIANFFAGAEAKYPEKCGPIRWDPAKGDMSS